MRKNTGTGQWDDKLFVCSEHKERTVQEEEGEEEEGPPAGEHTPWDRLDKDREERNQEVVL